MSKTQLCICCKLTNKYMLMTTDTNQNDQHLCLNCLLQYSSQEFEPTRLLAQPYLLKSNQNTDTQIAFNAEVRQEEYVGFCIVKEHAFGKKFFWPHQDLKIDVNNQTCITHKDAFAICQSYQQVNKRKRAFIRIEFRSNKQGDNCYFAVFAAKPIKLLQLFEKNKNKLLGTLRPACESKYEILLQKYQKLVFNAICPISKSYLKIPVRFRNCLHIQCFDLQSYELMRKIKKFNFSVECPLCKQTMLINDILIDVYQYDILRQEQEDFNNIDQCLQWKQSGFILQRNRPLRIGDYLKEIEDPYYWGLDWVYR